MNHPVVLIAVVVLLAILAAANRSNWRHLKHKLVLWALPVRHFCREFRSSLDESEAKMRNDPALADELMNLQNQLY